MATREESSGDRSDTEALEFSDEIGDYGFSDYDEEEDYDDTVLSLSEDGLDDEFDAAGDDLDDYDFRDALRAAGNFRVKAKSKSKNYYQRKQAKSTSKDLDPEIRMNLSLANEAFVRKDMQVALNKYLEVIKMDPRNFNAYKTIGEIYKSQGRLHECCNYWLLAANFQSWDSGFWANVADLSSELGYIDQAIYCYTRAISSDSTKNPQFIFERAMLYKEKKQYGRALEGFQKVHAIFPTDSGIVKQLASVYVEQKRLNDGINLYMNILDQNMNPDHDTQVPKFDWTELNILTELYLTQHSYQIGIKVVKLVSRWIQNRLDETWWDEQANVDIEFDNRRFDFFKLKPELKASMTREYSLPIDIRFKLGLLRLGLSDKDEAMRHFQYLLEEGDDVWDLHFEAGKALEAQGYNQEALIFLNRASESEEQTTIELHKLIAKCYLEVNEYHQAKDIYTSLVKDCPDDLDIKLALSEALFHLGEMEEASQILKNVSDTAKISDEIDEPEEEHMPLIRNTQLIRRSSKLTDQEKQDLENNAKRKVLEKFNRMLKLQESIDTDVAATAWIKLASQLVEMFIGVRSFFPRDKNRIFKGIILYKRKKQMGIDEKIARVYNLYEGIGGNSDNSRHELTSVTDFRGLDYDQWFFIFIQYAILLHFFEHNTEYAIQIVDICQSVSVFVQDKNKSVFMKLVKLLLCISHDDANGIMVNIRHFLFTNQFSPKIYKFFMCCFSSGLKEWSTFSNYNHQKFFLRHLKAYDAIMNSTKISGMATITATVPKGVTLKKGHLELLYVYGNLLGGSRSYVSSIVYLNRAYKDYNKDPMVCFILGLAHVHRAMQRLSTNRHLQLLQGLSYLLEYKDLRLAKATDYELQEIDYNFGRLFHTLGLPSIAVNFYNKVLEYHGKLDPDYDLLMEAAHNLALIYTFSGNTSLARKLTEEYLTI